MKVTILSSLFVLASLTMGSVSAGLPLAGTTPETKKQNLTFEQLKESCINPQLFHSQIPPKDITIRCDDMRKIWVPSQPLSFGFQASPEQRSVKIGLISDKYTVAEQAGQIPLEAKTGPCTDFTEMKQDYSMQQKVTCDEILAHQGSLIDYCTGKIDQNLQENKDLMNQAPTGRTFSTCQGQLENLQQK